MEEVKGFAVGSIEKAEFSPRFELGGVRGTGAGSNSGLLQFNSSLTEGRTIGAANTDDFSLCSICKKVLV